MKFFPAKYPGTCSHCDLYETFPEHLECYRYQGRFQVVHKVGCKDALLSELVPAIQFQVREEYSEIVIENQYLTDEVWDEFLTLVRGCEFVPEGRLNLVPPNALRGLVSAFLEHPLLGPITHLDEDTKALLQAETDAYNRSLAQVALKVKDGLSLYPFQVLGTAWLKTRSRALLADDMGLGKTIQALTAVPDGAPLLIVCPAVAKGVWKRELRKWRQDYRIVSVLKGRNSFRWPKPGRVIITNYDILSDEVSAPPKGTVIVFDEVHVTKNPKSAKHRRSAELSTQACTVYGLTATPLMNRPQELWSVLELLNLEEEAFGNFSSFCYAFDGSSSRGWGKPAPQAALGLQRVMLRRTKKEVLKQLPPKTRTFTEVDVTLSRYDKVVLAEAEEALFEYGENVPFELIAKARAITAKAKGPATLERVQEYEEADEPLVVFSYHREVVEKIGNRPGWGLIVGGVSASKRTEIEEAFQRGELRGVAGTMQAAGVSITLTRASNVLFVDRGWNPSINEQAEDRCNRIGQNRGVQIEVLTAANTIDAKVERIIEVKSEIIRESVDRASNVMQFADQLELEKIPEKPIGPASEGSYTEVVDDVWNEDIDW